VRIPGFRQKGFPHKFVPHQKIPSREALYAALAASLLWELAKQIFRFYLMNVADWNKVYGSFTLLFALVLWVYYSCIVFILGAEMGWLWSRKKKTAE
jgi:membrane protein